MWQCWLLFRCGIFARNIQRRISKPKKDLKDKTNARNAQTSSTDRARSPLPTKHREDEEVTIAV